METVKEERQLEHFSSNLDPSSINCHIVLLITCHDLKVPMCHIINSDKYNIVKIYLKFILLIIYIVSI